MVYLHESGGATDIGSTIEESRKEGSPYTIKDPESRGCYTHPKGIQKTGRRHMP